MADSRKKALKELKPLIDQAVQHLEACDDLSTLETFECLHCLFDMSSFGENCCENQYKLGKYLVNKGFGRLFPKMWKALSDSLSEDKWMSQGFCNLGEMLVVYLNFTNTSPDIGSDLGKCGCVELLFEGIERVSSFYNQAPKMEYLDHGVSSMFGILHNSIRLCRDNRAIYRASNAVAILKRFLKSDNLMMKTFSILILAYVVNETDSGILATVEGGVSFLVQLLKSAVEATEHVVVSFISFSAYEILDCLNHLAVNDTVKTEIERQDGIPAIIRMLQDDFTEEDQQAAAEALWNMSFIESIGQSTTLQQTIPTLEKLVESRNKDARGAWASALWQIKRSRVSGISSTANSPEEPPPSYQEAIGESRLTSTSQIMVSYQWDSKERARLIRDRLLTSGYKVWMDETNMRGDILASMADAVEKSDVILICMTERYKESKSCRSEATYAYKLKKNVLPLLLEDGYEPDGWLGLLQGMDLYYEFHSDDQIETNMENLLKAIKECTLTGEDEIEGPITMTQQDVGGATPIQSVPTLGMVVDWSTDDVQVWLHKNKLLDLCDTLDFCDGSQLEVLYDQYCQNPKEFMDNIRSDYQMSPKISLMFAGALKKLFRKN